MKHYQLGLRMVWRILSCSFLQPDDSSLQITASCVIDIADSKKCKKDRLVFLNPPNTRSALRKKTKYWKK